MLVPMPGDIDSSEYVNKFISSFQALCKKSHIRSAYKSGIYAITQHNGMLNQIAQEGNYWNVIANAGKNDILFKPFNCLSEVLLDNHIQDIVHFMYGLQKDQSTWPDSVKTFAFGN